MLSSKAAYKSNKTHLKAKVYNPISAHAGVKKTSGILETKCIIVYQMTLGRVVVAKQNIETRYWYWKAVGKKPSPCWKANYIFKTKES